MRGASAKIRTLLEDPKKTTKDERVGVTHTGAELDSGTLLALLARRRTVTVFVSYLAMLSVAQTT
jgi:hypothetical protein